MHIRAICGSFRRRVWHPAIPTPPSEVFPQNSQNSRKLLAEDILPRISQMLTEVYGVGFSHGFHRIHRNDCRRIFSHGFHGFPQMVRLRYWQRGYGRMPYPPNLCASVPICGRLSLPEGSVCSACSVGHSLCLLCWCCRGSCTSVVVFSHGIHGFPQMVRLRYWQRGYGRDAISS